jgi:hypothetical protein
MAKKSTTKTVTEEVVSEKENKETKKVVEQEPLRDEDEIKVVSLIPNVSYKDSKTLDMYEWDEVGHSEDMTFETLKNMWRNNKGYFRNMWLKPCDDRIINKFGLTKTYENYAFLMDKSNYNRKNIDRVCKTISETPKAMKRAICTKIKDMVVNGDVADASVIKKLEKHLNIDLIDFL